MPATEIEVNVEADDLVVLREHVQKCWEHLGRSRAHFSVRTKREYLPTSFGANETAFWSSGEEQVAWLVRILERHGMSSLDSKTCIDFICGVGRLTEPLARIFQLVHNHNQFWNFLKNGQQKIWVKLFF